jgi:tRNA G18 (ribose-2'-O)-methylase SpoU
MKVPELPTQLEPIVISEGCSVLLPFQNPDNIGAALRSCAAFGVTKVLLSSEAAHPFSVKSLRASGPVAFGLNIIRVGPFRSLEVVDERSLFVFDASGTSIRDLSHSPLSRLLVFGSEGQGVKGFIPSGQRIAIPMSAGVESLNAAQTVAIALFHFFDSSAAQ